MRPAVIVACAVLLTAAGCRDGGRPASTPAPAATAAVTGAPTVTVAPEATPPAITAANAGTLQSALSFAAADNVQRLAWANDGRLLLVDTNGVVAVDATTGAAKRLLDLVDVRVLAVGSTVAGDLAAVAGRESTVRLVDLASGQVVQSLDPGGVTNAAMFFTGDRVALVSADRIEITLWDVGSGQQVGTLTGFQTAAPVYNVTIANDGYRAAWVARGTLQFSEVASGVFGARQQFEDFIGAYTFLPDARTFATTIAAPVGNVPEGRVQLWDAQSGDEVLRIALPSPPLALAASNATPASGTLLATGGDGFALWSTVDGRQLLAVPEATAGRVRLVSFAPDGSALATADDSGAVCIWRPAP